MEVASDRRYGFDTDREHLWAALTDVGAYRAWWPWLAGFDGDRFEAGATWHCVVQPPLPYRLRFSILLREVDPGRRATAAVEGDIVGTAELTIADGPGGGSEARLRSVLAPANPLLRRVAAVGRPVVRLGHDWVLDTGASQFRRKAL